MRTMDEGTTNAIEVRNLEKGYKGVQALHDVSLAVGRGTVFALLGPNGSGKTTTINVLTTLLKADGGTATVAGFDVAEQPSKVREQISVTGQFAAVDHVLTARENLVLMGELRHVADPGQTAADLLDKFDLNEAADRRLGTFSGGMRRRLDIAMSLVGDAPIIFFDEPTTGLDPKGRTDMWLTIRHLVENGTTVFLTTQYLEEADRLADEIAILHGGRIVASGTSDELKAMVPTGLVELEFGEEAQLAAAQRALGEQHEVDRVDSKLVVATSGSVAEMADLFIRLKDSGIEPIGMLLLFVYVFGGAIGQQTGSIEYVDFITPGVVIMTVASGIAYAAFRLSTDLHKGIISRFRTMPVTPSSVLTGQALSSTLSNLFSCLLVIVVAFLVGFRPEADAAAWLLFGALLALFTLATTWLAMLFGLLAKTVEAARRVTEASFRHGPGVSESSHVGPPCLRRRRRRLQLHPPAPHLHQPFVRPDRLHEAMAERLRQQP